MDKNSMRSITSGLVLALFVSISNIAFVDAKEKKGDEEVISLGFEDSAEDEQNVEPAALPVMDEETVGENAVEKKPVDPGVEEVLRGKWTRKIVFETDSGNVRFQPGMLIQPLFNLHIDTDLEHPLESSGFALQRARLRFSARLFKMIGIYLDAGFNDGRARLVDYYLDFFVLSEKLAFRVGYFRPWFIRQFLMSTAKLQMVDYARAWTDPLLGINSGRQLGGGAFGLINDSFEYGVGVWNGDADAGRFNRGAGASTYPDGELVPGNIDMMVGGRLAVHPLAMAGVGDPLLLGDESDARNSTKPALSVGVAAIYNRTHDRFVIGPGPNFVVQPYYDNQLKLGVDAGFKMKGLSIIAEFFFHHIDTIKDTPEAVDDILDDLRGVDPLGRLILGNGFGTYVQAGYFVLKKKLEVTGRFDMLDESLSIRGRRLYPALGASYFFFGNNLKAQLMYRMNIASGYEESDPGYHNFSQDVLLMLQASI